MLQSILVLLCITLTIWIMPRLRRRFSSGMYFCGLCIVFVVYVSSNLYFTLFSRVPMTEAIWEWCPFASYIRIFRGVNATEGNVLKGWLAEFFLTTSHPIQTIILNIFLYVPLGYLLPEIFPRLSNKQVLQISFAATVCTELTQLIFKLGWCEMDDLIHNMLGAIIGLGIYRWQIKKVFSKQQIRSDT